MFFQAGGTGPMLGQAHHFRNYAPEKIPYAIDRYTNEGKRLYGVVDRRLSESKYLAGDEYTIADIMNLPWLLLSQEPGHRHRRVPARRALDRRAEGPPRRAAGPRRPAAQRRADGREGARGRSSARRSTSGARPHRRRLLERETARGKKGNARGAK